MKKETRKWWEKFGKPEYGGEPTSPPRQQPRPAYNRPAPGRPAPAQPQAQQPAPNYDAGDSIPEDAAPPIKEDDIPF